VNESISKCVTGSGGPGAVHRQLGGGVPELRACHRSDRGWLLAVAAEVSTVSGNQVVADRPLRAGFEGMRGAASYRVVASVRAGACHGLGPTDSRG
jgi:hypothetical protein